MCNFFSSSSSLFLSTSPTPFIFPPISRRLFRKKGMREGKKEMGKTRKRTGNKTKQNETQQTESFHRFASTSKPGVDLSECDESVFSCHQLCLQLTCLFSTSPLLPHPPSLPLSSYSSLLVLRPRGMCIYKGTPPPLFILPLSSPSLLALRPTGTCIYKDIPLLSHHSPSPIPPHTHSPPPPPNPQRLSVV